MISVHVPCQPCSGAGGYFDSTFGTWNWRRCETCDGVGKSWAPGAPSYGCDITLADRDPGEVVTLGTGEQAKILWHMPRRSKKIRPETTFLGMIGEFDGVESHNPIPFPSSVGVRSIDVCRVWADHDAHDRSKDEDVSDPIFRKLNGRMI